MLSDVMTSLTLNAAPGQRRGVDLDRFASVTLNDFVVEIQSVTIHGRQVQRAVATLIMDEPHASIRHTELRIICSKLGVTEYKNKRKFNMASLIAAKKLNEEIYDAAVPVLAVSASETSVHCRFRLLYVLFSDEFAELLATWATHSQYRSLMLPSSKTTSYGSLCSHDIWMLILLTWTNCSSRTQRSTTRESTRVTSFHTRGRSCALITTRPDRITRLSWTDRLQLALTATSSLTIATDESTATI
jgi:hypothetical protein